MIQAEIIGQCCLPMKLKMISGFMSGIWIWKSLTTCADAVSSVLRRTVDASAAHFFAQRSAEP